MAERFSLPPVITASKWGNVWGSLWDQSKRGFATDDEGTTAPVWTNREAAAIVAAMKQVAKRTPDGFPLWYQFAAAAYGWSPEQDSVDASQAQADALYSPEYAVLLSKEMQRIGWGLEDAKVPDPRLQIDDVFDTLAFKSQVSLALVQDGAEASFKIPIPACKDPKTGKPAKPIRDKNGKWKCPGGVVVIDDPITAIGKSLGQVVGPLAIILIAAAMFGKRHNRRGGY